VPPIASKLPEADVVFNKMMVPVDLEHIEALKKSLQVAAELAQRYAIEVVYVGITGIAAGSAAKTPEAYAKDLELFAKQQAELHDISASAEALACVDLAADKDSRLLQAAMDCQADLIVMASHVPGIADRLHLIGSNAAWMVRHSEVSVFVVR
jgi:nucleotide-binding universal stress UspA family protein